MKTRDTLKQDLLKHYETMEPQGFYQYDGFVHSGSDDVMPPDADDDALSKVITHELMCGSTVRVLVTAGTTEEDALRLLKKIRVWIKKDGFAFHREALARKEVGLDDEVCPRCGAAMQATHNPLCQSRDGTPTALTDEEVRKALAEIEAGGAVAEEEISL